MSDESNSLVGHIVCVYSMDSPVGLKGKVKWENQHGLLCEDVVWGFELVAETIVESYVLIMTPSQTFIPWARIARIKVWYGEPTFREADGITSTSELDDNSADAIVNWLNGLDDPEINAMYEQRKKFDMDTA